MGEPEPERIEQDAAASAHRRAAEAMQSERYEDALAAADLAIGALLHRGLNVEDFLSLSARGAGAEGVLRYERDLVARNRSLHEPLAIRWEALRRLGRVRDARLMRNVCLRHFPERASVWATAGNQALDEGDLGLAEQYFARCLHLNPDWTAGLAGMAILYESRKDWARALPFRRRVVVREGSLEHGDPASLQRAIRYGAALARVGRWKEAGVVLRRAESRGAYARLPAERPVLLRAFSRELYAPALVARCLTSQETLPELDEAQRLALHEAGVLEQVIAAISGMRGLPRGEVGVLLGMCAWLAGDHAQAYALLDEAESDEADPTLQFLLLSSATALAAPDLPSIAQFAEAASQAVLAQSERANPEHTCFALLTAAELSARALPLPGAEMDEQALPRQGDRPLAAAEAQADLFAVYEAAYREADPPHGELAPARGGDLRARLTRIVVYRAARLTRGGSPLAAAAASAQALHALLDDSVSAAAGRITRS